MRRFRTVIASGGLPARLSANPWRIRCAALLALVVAAGSDGAFAAEPPDREQVLARIDSLHVARRVDDAEAYIAPLLAGARAAADTSLVLPLTAKLGRLWAAFGHPRRGEPLLAEAAALAEACRDTARLCDALRWLGFSIEQQGRAEEAVAIYRRLLGMSEAAGDRRHEAWARIGLAYRAVQEGRYLAAIDEYRRGHDIFMALSDTSAAVWTLNGLGAAQSQEGDLKSAATTFGRVADLAGRVGYVAVEALAHNNQGTLEFKLGDPGVAMAHFRRAAALQRGIDQIPDAMSSETNVAVCLSHLGRYDEAETLLSELVEECVAGRLGYRESFVRLELAAIRSQRGDLGRARELYELVLLDPDRPLEIHHRIGGTVGYALTLTELGEVEAALAHLQQTEAAHGPRIRGIGRIHFDLAMGELLGSLDRPAEALLRYEAALAATGPEPRNERVEALAGAARCRRILGEGGAALADLRTAASVWEDVRAAAGDFEWREQRGSLGRLVSSQLAAAMLDEGATPAAAFDAVQVFKARTLLERIGARERADTTSVPSLASLQREVLRAGELLLDAYLGPDESVLFAVTVDTCAATRLDGVQDLEDRLRVLHELLSQPPVGEEAPVAADVAVAAAHRFAAELLGALAPLVAGSERVILAPDGVLNLVPLGGEFAGAGGGSRADWARIPSATLLAHLHTVSERDPGAVRGGILAAAAAATPGGQALPGARREVQVLAEAFRQVDTRLVGDGDALAPLDLAGPDVLHLATHAQMDDQRPWNSEIMLDPTRAAGRLRAATVADLDLPARLAVLSACETGSGRVLSGEGVLGLSTAFLGAGVSAVVASLWPVDDASTADLMAVFYAELAEGRDVAAALAAAKRSLRGDPTTAHPFHWAGFVVIGDGGVTVDLVPRRSPARSLAAAAGVAAALLAVFLVRRRRRGDRDAGPHAV